MAVAVDTPAGMAAALAAAEPQGPAALPYGDAGAALALACHCVMAACPAGLRICLPSGETPDSRFATPPAWATSLKDEWVYRYAAPGKSNRLVLHCSLQRASGRMLVHTFEVNNERNSHLLGLQLEKYVPRPEALQGSSWQGVVEGPAAIAGMMQEHVIAPLLELAEELPQGDTDWLAPDAGTRTWAYWAAGGGAVWPAVGLTALALASVAAYVVLASRRRGRR